MKKTTWFVLVGIVLVVLCCVCVIASALIAYFVLDINVPSFSSLFSPSETAANQFLTALKSENYARAFDMCDDQLQHELVNTSTLQRRIEENNLQPKRWNFTKKTVKGDAAEYLGRIDYQNGGQGPVRVTLQKSDGKWLVIGLSLDTDR